MEVLREFHFECSEDTRLMKPSFTVGLPRRAMFRAGILLRLHHRDQERKLHASFHERIAIGLTCSAQRTLEETAACVDLVLFSV
jgi:hypothetical protein